MTGNFQLQLYLLIRLSGNISVGHGTRHLSQPSQSSPDIPSVLTPPSLGMIVAIVAVVIASVGGTVAFETCSEDKRNGRRDMI
jgi:hypothetical protein